MSSEADERGSAAPGSEGGSLGGVGLCGRCIHARVVENRRGSRFWLCRLSRRDPSFPKYPRLPVHSCPGFEAEAGETRNDREESRR